MKSLSGVEISAPKKLDRNLVYEARYVYKGDPGTVIGKIYVEPMPAKRLCQTFHDKMSCARKTQKMGNVRTVDFVYVDDAWKRRGIATKLYEAAAKDGCAAGEPLVSYYRTVGARSNDFWAKQRAKKRTVAIAAWYDEDHKDRPALVEMLKCSAAHDLSGAKKTMPKKSSGRCVGVRRKMTKRCSEHAFKENIRHCMCLTARPREQCVAIAYSQLEKTCGVKPRKRQTPKKIVAAAKAKKRR